MRPSKNICSTQNNPLESSVLSSSRTIFLSLLAWLTVMIPAAGQLPDWVDLHNRADQIDLNQARQATEREAASEADFYVLGLVYLNRHETARAREAFEKILDGNPDSREGRWGMAEVYRREHRYDKSRELLNQLIEEYPDYASPVISLAYVNYVNMDFPAAAQWAARAINLGDDRLDRNNFLRAHGLYAAAKGMIAYYGGPLSKVINHAAVVRHLNIIEERAPEHPVVTFGIGSYHMLIPPVLGRDLEKAREYLEKTIEADPLFPDPYVRLAQIYRIKGDRQKYRDLITKALELDPKNELALDIETRQCNFICFDDKN